MLASIAAIASAPIKPKSRVRKAARGGFFHNRFFLRYLVCEVAFSCDAPVALIRFCALSRPVARFEEVGALLLAAPCVLMCVPDCPPAAAAAVPAIATVANRQSAERVNRMVLVLIRLKSMQISSLNKMIVLDAKRFREGVR